jgi:beta-phosphoglucomutase
MQSLDIILSLGGISLSQHEKEQLANKKNSWFVDYLERMAPEEIFPGVQPLIQALRTRGMKIALASSSRNAKTVIQLLHIQHEFDVVVDGDMITHSKPHPEIFLLAAKLLAVEPRHCVVFEDAEAGVEAALAAGMKCVGVGMPEQLGKADMVITKTGEFTTTALQQWQIV